MADPFSAFAGALSTVDVTIRSCKGLFDAAHAYKSAPQEVEKLRGTIRDLESILRNTRLWIVEYHSSRSATQYHEVLPEAVTDCIQGINTSLKDLSDLLPSQDESRQIRERSRWILHKGRIKKLQECLEGQKENLHLCLQTVAQRSHLKLHTELEGLEALHWEQLEHSDNLKNGQHAISLQLDDITKNVESSTTVNEYLKAAIDSVVNHEIQNSRKLDTVTSTLTRLQLAQGSVDDNTLLEASAVDSLTRIIRTELRKSLIPMTEASFQKHLAINDQKLDGLRQAIDVLSADVGRKTSVPQESQYRFIKQEDIAQSQGNMMLPGKNLNDTSSPSWEEGMIPRKQDQRAEYCVYHWRLNLGIGQAWVHVTTRTKKKHDHPAQAYEIQKQPFSRDYNFTIGFDPSQSLLTKKGFALLYKVKQDHQSTYPAISPSITFFNVVPKDADIMRFARENDVEGIKRLFAQRRASPYDRDLDGRSVLCWAALTRNLAVCQFLLDQGADQSNNGLLAKCVTFNLILEAYYSELHENIESSIYDRYSLEVIRLLLNKRFELIESSPIALALASKMKYDSFRGTLPQRSHRLREICSVLRELGFDPIPEIQQNPLIPYILSTSTSSLHRFKWEDRYCTMAWLCELGVILKMRGEQGLQPLHILFGQKRSAEVSERVIELAVLLLDYGADPCALDGDGMPVPFCVALWGWEDEFAEALSRCDVNLINVLAESKRRLCCFFDPVAVSTAIEDSVTGGPSSKCLSRRKGFVRSDCNDDTIEEEHLSRADRRNRVARDKQLLEDFLFETMPIVKVILATRTLGIISRLLKSGSSDKKL